MNQYIKRIISLSLVLLLSAQAAFAEGEYDNVDLDAQYNTNTYIFDTVQQNNFSDIQDTETAKRAQILSELGVMGGFDDGTFRPEETITRLEFLGVVLQACGIYITTDMNGKFYDVSEEEEKYIISTAVSRGIITGFSDNTFRPDDPITADDALVMLMNGFGYGTLAQEFGGYMGGYLRLTDILGMRLPVSGSNPINREEALDLVWECLDSRYLVLDGNIAAQMGYSLSTDTALEAFFDTYKAEGQVTATHITALEGTKTLEDTIKIGSETFFTGGRDYSSYLGCLTDYYYVDENGDKTILYMALNRSVKTVQIDAEDILSYENYILTYQDGNRDRTLEIAVGHSVIYNDRVLRKYTEEDFLPQKGGIVLISNGTKTYSIVRIESYENIYLQSVVSDGDTIILTPYYNLPAIKIDPSETDFYIYDATGKEIVYNASIEGMLDADGNPVTQINLSNIPSDAIVSLYADQYTDWMGYRVPADTAEYIRAVISTETVTGTVTGFGTTAEGRETILIDGNTYEKAAGNFLDEANVSIGMACTILLDAAGKAVAAKQDTSVITGWQYGYLIRGYRTEEENALQLKMMTATGEVKRFDTKDKIRINGKAYRDAEEAIDVLSVSAQLLDDSFTISQPVKYKQQDEETISELQVVTQSVRPAGDTEYDMLTREAARTAYTTERASLYGLASGTSGVIYQQPKLIFRVPSVEEGNDDSDYQVLANTTEMTNELMDVYDAGTFKAPELAVVYTNASLDLIRVQGTQAYPVMIKDVTWVLDEDELPVMAATVVTGLNERTYYDDGRGAFETCKKGDVVLLKGVGDTVMEATPVTIGGIPISADTIPSASEILSDSVAGVSRAQPIYFGELYGYENRFLILQMGATDGQIREKQMLLPWIDNTAVVQGGAILYDATNGKPDIRVALESDLKGAYTYGTAKSSKIFAIVDSYGQLRQFICYNF